MARKKEQPDRGTFECSVCGDDLWPTTKENLEDYCQICKRALGEYYCRKCWDQSWTVGLTKCDECKVSVQQKETEEDDSPAAPD